MEIAIAVLIASIVQLGIGVAIGVSIENPKIQCVSEKEESIHQKRAENLR